VRTPPAVLIGVGRFCYPCTSFEGHVERVTVVAKQKKSLLDDLTTRLRGLLEELDRLIIPQPPKPVRVPVPVPVRSRRPNPYDPYR